MTDSLREDLNTIEQLLMGRNGKQLWDILTALRGPDKDNDYYKNATTSLIRRRAFPKLFVDGSAFGSMACTAVDRQDLVEYRLTFDPAYNHFRCHVMWAFDALGLSWNVVNPKEPQNEQSE